MNDIAHLLAPVSDHEPCGPFMGQSEAHTKIRMAVDSHVKMGKTPMFSWATIEAQCREYLGRSKHLEIALALARVWQEQRGVEGLRDGLALAEALLERWPDAVHPLPEEGDWSSRGNLLLLIAEDDPMAGDEFGFVKCLRSSPPATISPADTEISREIQGCVQRLGDALRPRVPKSLRMDFSTLVQNLPDLAPAPSLPVPNNPAPPPTLPASATPPPPANRREDALLRIRQARAYFREQEPNSPLAPLLDRVLRIANLTFPEVIAELLPDSQAKLTDILGNPEKSKGNERSSQT